jgi:flagellar biosynthesis chaperone FliJ
MTKAQTQIKTLLGEQFSTIQTLSTTRINYRTTDSYIDDEDFYDRLATLMKLSPEEVEHLYKSVDIYERHFINQEVAA